MFDKKTHLAVAVFGAIKLYDVTNRCFVEDFEIEAGYIKTGSFQINFVSGLYVKSPTF